MRGDTVVRFEAPGPDVLDRVAREALPGGLRDAGPGEDCFFRDLYYDTPEGDLERRGATVRVRIRDDGQRTLAVEVRDVEPREGEGELPVRTALVTAPEVDADELFRGLAEPARLLRAMVDPERLVPWLEVETRRRVRRAVRPRDDAGEQPPVEVFCDRMTVREADLAADVFEVEVRIPGGTKGRKKLLRALEEDFGLEVAAEPLPVRARRSLAEEEVDWLVDAVRAARRVAVVAWCGGRAAVLRDDDARLRLPAGAGTGEEVAHAVLREAFGDLPARLRLLGTGSGSPHRPATEVWLADSPDVAPHGDAVLRLPLGELLAAVGSPALRDDATLAALNVLARTALPLHPQNDGAEDRRAEADAAHRGLRAAADERRSAEEEAAELPPGTLLNSELSILAFNRRVLALAEDEATPPLERVRFLSIFGANLDEFFRVRVAGFKRQVAEGSEKRTMDGVTPEEQLDAIGVRARRLTEAAYDLLYDELLPDLEDQGVRVLRPAELTDADREHLRAFYEEHVHAVLTPLTAGPGHPFPHIRNLRPAIAALLYEPLTGAERLGVVELPDEIPRFVPLPGGRGLVALEILVRESLPRLYPGLELGSACTFRVTRSAELHLRGVVGDLLRAVEEEVRQRRFRPVVRLEVEHDMPPRVREVLLRELRHEAPERAESLGEEDIYSVPGLIDLRGLRELSALDVPGGRWPEEQPADPLDPDRPIFSQLREREVLVYFPFHSFEATVERFVVEAADDPDVLAIKLALYRTNRKSRIVEALRRASARGKQVVALVELTARFDEEANIEWARRLRADGIHVVYGLTGLKTHAKVALVVRREEGRVRRYVYVGTGNLNATTAAAYTDLGLFSADEELGEDATDLFHMLTGAAGVPEFRRLLVAPHTMRKRFLEMIEREAEHARAGREARITAKMNGLADRETIAALYEANGAGVRIDLIVRSLCALRPGVPGLSENIRVVSVLGRYLEHARIFRFANGGSPEHYVGSADWRTRNLSARVEVVAPVRDPVHRARLDRVLDGQLADPGAWELGPDGTYYRGAVPAAPDAPPGSGGADGRVPILT